MHLTPQNQSRTSSHYGAKFRGITELRPGSGRRAEHGRVRCGGKPGHFHHLLGANFSGVVAVLALRELRPRTSGRNECRGLCRLQEVVAPLVRGATARKREPFHQLHGVRTSKVVEMVALRPFRPRQSGRNERRVLAGCTRSLRRWYAALRLASASRSTSSAALLVAARQVPPPSRGYCSQREQFHQILGGQFLHGGRSSRAARTPPAYQRAEGVAWVRRIAGGHCAAGTRRYGSQARAVPPPPRRYGSQARAVPPPPQRHLSQRDKFHHLREEGKRLFALRLVKVRVPREC